MNEGGIEGGEREGRNLPVRSSPRVWERIQFHARKVYLAT